VHAAHHGRPVAWTRPRRDRGCCAR
jgi:hypothetical protein